MSKISVCIPTYNRVNFLLYAIQSVLNQTYTDFELIICDDNSTDGTLALISEFPDSRINYIRHSQNIGKSNNIRSGFEAASGQFFMQLDDRVRLKPEFLERTSAILLKDYRIDFVTTDRWLVDPQNQIDEMATKLDAQRSGRTELPTGMIQNLLEVVFVKQSLPIGSTLFRRQALQAIKFMRLDERNSEENDLFVRLAIARKRGYFLPEFLMEERLPETHRTIPNLIDKLAYLTSYEFDSEPLIESVRLQRIAETELALGLRFIEANEIAQGRKMLWAGKSFSPLQAGIGFVLSLLPKEWRTEAFNYLRS